MAMADLAKAVPFRLDDVGKPPVTAPVAESELTPNDIADYVTPPPKKVIVVAVRYCEAIKGAPMPYDLPDADEGP
jgi:hypothetical protein